jgi:Tfp pilus assembly major pilin PilA
MRVVSFDIGIRNLAVCVMETFECVDVVPRIVYWSVINLLEESDQRMENKKCNGITLKGKGCKRVAVFKNKSEKLFCKMHSSKDPEALSCTLSEVKFKKKRKIKTLKTQDMCKLLYEKLNDVIKNDYDFLTAKRILIELQPGKNPRMKSLSNMLYSYFSLKTI